MFFRRHKLYRHKKTMVENSCAGGEKLFSPPHQRWGAPLTPLPLLATGPLRIRATVREMSETVGGLAARPRT